ncbi:MAG TPA: hypothetical protein VFQ88_07705 [Nevskiaceae bacterium]|nr:hypothetical protein [Nevskiaceae bacterium]
MTRATIRDTPRHAERPLLLSGAMVRAVLSGRKTQTRRPVSSLFGFGRIRGFGPSGTAGYSWHFRDQRALWNDVSDARVLTTCLYGSAGDRLWIRETWQAVHHDRNAAPEGAGWHAAYDVPPGPGQFWRVAYAANADKGVARIVRGYVWRPSIHMPRWASRMTLVIGAVSIERLHSISGEDALAEGMGGRSAFRETWDALYASRGYGWGADPWVWVLKWSRVDPGPGAACTLSPQRAVPT